MIKAKEAREIAKKVWNTELRKELEHVEKEIRNAASCGHFYVEFLTISYNVRSHLCEEGYLCYVIGIHGAKEEEKLGWKVTW